jgi:hypothetical protein
MKVWRRELCVFAFLAILVFAVFEIRHSSEPRYEGRLLRQLLRNEKSLGTKKNTLSELLTLKQITTGKEPDIATFEVPVSYDAVTNLGELELLVDGKNGEYKGKGEFQECDRATNGDCLLAWNTTFDAPGQHHVQAWLLVNLGGKSFAVTGPSVSFYSTNVCQFDPVWSDFHYSDFDSTHGAILYAKLPESNATYSIEINTSNGVHLKTITGSTSNGEILVHWDLTDDHGNVYTNGTFKDLFHITFPDGRSGTQKLQQFVYASLRI